MAELRETLFDKLMRIKWVESTGAFDRKNDSQKVKVGFTRFRITKIQSLEFRDLIDEIQRGIGHLSPQEFSVAQGPIVVLTIGIPVRLFVSRGGRDCVCNGEHRFQIVESRGLRPAKRKQGSLDQSRMSYG